MGNIFTVSGQEPDIQETVSYSSLIFSGTAPVVEKNGMVNKSFVSELEKVLQGRGIDSQPTNGTRIESSLPKSIPRPREDDPKPKSISILAELKNHPMFKNQNDSEPNQSNQTIVVCTESDSDMMDFFIIELPNQKEGNEKKENTSDLDPSLVSQDLFPKQNPLNRSPLSTHICSFDRSTLKMVQRSEKPLFRSDLEKALFEKFKSIRQMEQ